MVSETRERFEVDSGRKPLDPTLWLYAWAKMDSVAEEHLRCAGTTWAAGNRRASIQWLRDLVMMIGSRCKPTENAKRAQSCLSAIVERLEQEAFKVELLWLCGVPSDGKQSEAGKASELIASGALPFNALGIRRH